MPLLERTLSSKAQVVIKSQDASNMMIDGRSLDRRSPSMGLRRDIYMMNLGFRICPRLFWDSCYGLLEIRTSQGVVMTHFDL